MSDAPEALLSKQSGFVFEWVSRTFMGTAMPIAADETISVVVGDWISALLDGMGISDDHIM